MYHMSSQCITHYKMQIQDTIPVHSMVWIRHGIRLKSGTECKTVCQMRGIRVGCSETKNSGKELKKIKYIKIKI